MGRSSLLPEALGSRSLSSTSSWDLPLQEFVFEVDSFRNTSGGSTYATEQHDVGDGTMDGDDDDDDDGSNVVYGMRLGGIDDEVVHGISAAMTGTFALPASDCVEIGLEYAFDCLGLAGTTAYADVLLSIDGAVHGVGIYDYVHSCSGQRVRHDDEDGRRRRRRGQEQQRNGMLRTATSASAVAASSSDATTSSFDASDGWWVEGNAPFLRSVGDDLGHGWSLHSWTSPTELSAGEHRLRVGAYLSQKDGRDRRVDLRVRNVRIRPAGGCTARRTRPCRRTRRSNDGDNGNGGGGIVEVTPNLPPPGADATPAIQEAVNEAGRIARNEFDDDRETCTVQVSVPPGTHTIAGGVFLIDRVHLKGSGVDRTVLYRTIPPEVGKHGIGVHLGDLGPTAQGHMHLSDIAIVMEYDMEVAETGNDWSFPGGHCIRGGKGIHDFEIRSVRLEGCGTYGIGLQMHQRNSTSPDSGAYQRLSIQNLKMNWIANDGIDMKSLYAGENDPDLQNNDIDIENLFIMNIGLKATKWASAVDLAGANVRIKRLMAVQTVSDIRGSLNGLMFRSDERRVSNTLVEDLFVYGFYRGVAISEDSTRALFTGGTISQCGMGVWIQSGVTMVDGRDMCLLENGRNIQGEINVDNENDNNNNVWHYLTEDCGSWEFVPAAFL